MNQGPAPTPPAAQRRGDRRLPHRGGPARPQAVDLGDRRDPSPGEILLGVRAPARRSMSAPSRRWRLSAYPGRMLSFASIFGHLSKVGMSRESAFSEKCRGDHMKAQNSALDRGAALMLIASLAFIGYAVVFLFRNFAGSGFE